MGKHLILTWLGAALAGCGNPGYVFIEEITGSDITSPDGGDLSADTSQAICGQPSETANMYLCSLEPFSAHYARVTVSNLTPAEVPAEGEPADPTSGGVYLTGYELTFLSEENGPELKSLSGKLSVALAADTSVTFSLPLVTPTMKETFAAAGSLAPQTYSVELLLTGRGGLEIEGGVSLLIGPFDKCPAESTNLGNDISNCL